MSLQSEFETLVGASWRQSGLSECRPCRSRKTVFDVFPGLECTGDSDMDSEEIIQLFNTVLQVDACAATYTEAVNLAHDVRMKLREWERQNKVRQEKDLYEVETGLHHVVCEISVWHP